MEDFFSRFQAILGNNFSKYSNSEVITPLNIVKDMVDLLPADIFNPDTKFLDPAVKSGRFLAEIYRRLFDSPLLSHMNEANRKEHILKNQLYGFATSAVAATIVRKQLYDDPTIAGNIVYTADKVSKELIQGAFDIMKFDVVIGNPPYNNDIYLDFVTEGHKLASKYTVMITPAKWQAKGGKKNEDFRKNVVPYMSKIVFFPCCYDVFNIAEPDGISYYLIDKSIHNSKEITNICKKVPRFNGCETREIGNSLLNSAVSILERIMSKTVEYVKINTSRTYFVKANQFYGGSPDNYDVIFIGGSTDGTKSIYGYAKIDYITNAKDIDKYKAVMSFKIGSNCILDSNGKVTVINPIKCLNPKEICKDDFMVLGLSNTEEEIQSMVSYYGCNLIKFLLWAGNVGANASNQEFWRFVPAPEAFNHIFTDQELYSKYGLTDEEIKIIESVIK